MKIGSFLKSLFLSVWDSTIAPPPSVTRQQSNLFKGEQIGWEFITSSIVRLSFL